MYPDSLPPSPIHVIYFPSPESKSLSPIVPADLLRDARRSSGVPRSGGGDEAAEFALDVPVSVLPTGAAIAVCATVPGQPWNGPELVVVALKQVTG
mgnify:CR=1 FL=1